MPNAEVFMCSGSYCQARNTLQGYGAPAVDPTQYIKLLKFSSDSHTSTAVFSRSLSAAAGAKLSYNITDKTMGLIFARGAWTGYPMPQGAPAKHDDNTIGRSQVNFIHPSPSPSPGPSPGPAPAKKAGVWPDRFDANMTIAKGQAPSEGGILLETSFFARLRYDFPSRSQIWQYYDLADPSKYIGGELWVGEMLYELGSDGSCFSSNMTFDIIRPDWLQGTDFATTNFLLRQPANTANPPGLSNYTRSDLFKLPNTIGMTNSWLVADSPIAEPIRLEGPNDFNHPTFRSILEYANFEPQKSISPSVFHIPAACNKSATGADDLKQLSVATAAASGSDGSRQSAFGMSRFFEAIIKQMQQGQE